LGFVLVGALVDSATGLALELGSDEGLVIGAAEGEADLGLGLMNEGENVFGLRIKEGDNVLLPSFEGDKVRPSKEGDKVKSFAKGLNEGERVNLRESSRSTPRRLPFGSACLLLEPRDSSSMISTSSNCSQ